MTPSLVPLSSLANGTVYALTGGLLTPASGATAFVYEHGTTTQVDVYTTRTGETTLTQPLTSATSGQLPGYVLAEQDLDIVATYEGKTPPAAEIVPLCAADLVGVDSHTSELALGAGVLPLLSGGGGGGVSQAELAAAAAAAQAVAEAASDAVGTAAADVATEKTRALAAEALLMPLAQKGVASGVGSLDSEGHQPVSQLSPSVVTSSTKVHGEAEGEQAPNLAEGHVHTYIAKGAFVLEKPTNWPEGTIYVKVVITEDATGSHTITTPGLVWIGGPEPKWNTAANAENVISLVSFDGGTHWFGEAAPEGATGPEGAEGFVPSKQTLPSAINMFLAPGASTVEARAALAQSTLREGVNGTLILTSGTAVFGALPAKKGLVCTGLAWLTTTTEGTAANRTHLWVALLNAAGEVVAVSEDFTSSEHTSLPSGTAHALKFSAPYTALAEELLTGVLCEVMSSTNPITIATKEGGGASALVPVLAGTAGAGLTTPPALKSKPVLTSVVKQPYMVIV